MTENVRQGFHHQPKSLIFPMGIFRTRKIHKIECLEHSRGPNGLKFSTIDSKKPVQFENLCEKIIKVAI